jgi:hypothetical protein
MYVCADRSSRSRLTLVQTADLAHHAADIVVVVVVDVVAVFLKVVVLDLSEPSLELLERRILARI